MKKVPILLVLAFIVAWMITFTDCKKDAEIPVIFGNIIQPLSNYWTCRNG